MDSKKLQVNDVLNGRFDVIPTNALIWRENLGKKSMIEHMR